MEARPVSDKRKRPTSNDFNGAPIGSKIRGTESPRKRPKPRSSALLKQHLVKDLRSHRVFSPGSELYRDISKRKLGFQYGCAEPEDESKSTKDGELGFQSEDQEDFDNWSGVSKVAEVLSEQCSEAKASADFRVSGNCGNGREKFPNGNAQNHGSVAEGFGAIGENNMGSDSKTKSFIRPCFQRKVFKNPGSVSYRRLLPYLTDISKQKTCEREIDQLLKLDNGAEGKKLQATLSSQSDRDSKDGSETDKVSVERQNRCNILQKVVLQCENKSNGSEKLKLTSSVNVALSPSTTGADACLSNPFMNGNIQGSDMERACQDHKLNNLNSFLSNAVEDLLVVKDNEIHTSSDAKVLKDNVCTGETNNGFPCNGQDGDVAKVNLSSAAGGSHLGKDVELAQYSEDTKQPECDGVTNTVIVHLFEGQKQREMKNEKGGDDGEVMNQVNDLNEDFNQMTPPDVEIFDRPVVERNGNAADRPDHVLNNWDHLHGKLSNCVNHGNSSLDYKRHEINSKCRGVLKPRSQTKLFKSPGSFSYRRMLPFIINIVKDHSDASANCQFTKPLKQPSLLAPDNQEIPLDKTNSLEFEENREDDSSALPATVLMPVNDPSNDKENLTSAAHRTEIQMPFNSEKEELLPVNEIVSDIRSELKASPELLTSVQPTQDASQPAITLCPTNTESSSREQLAISNHDQSSPKAAKASDCVKSVEAKRLENMLSRHDYLVSSRIPAGGQGPIKGILKRNPRGCRGLCSCLNCASFRLHAERAFEFSRNQMEDTQELVLELVNELSYLRNVLERSTDWADDHNVIRVNQVKLACRKASEAEELAKDRLSHMTYDLGVHCRITCLERPRVKFANHVEELIIPNPKANFSDNEVSELEKENSQRESNQTR